MIGIYVCTAIALVAAGALAGVLIVVAFAIRREDHRLSLTTDINDRVALGARALTGVYTRRPQSANRGGPQDNLLA